MRCSTFKAVLCSILLTALLPVPSHAVVYANDNVLSAVAWAKEVENRLSQIILFYRGTYDAIFVGKKGDELLRQLRKSRDRETFVRSVSEALDGVSGADGLFLAYPINGIRIIEVRDVGLFTSNFETRSPTSVFDPKRVIFEYAIPMSFSAEDREWMRALARLQETFPTLVYDRDKRQLLFRIMPSASVIPEIIRQTEEILINRT